ncbi:universal stress protein (plasmid) [Halostagnicola larsenii XH-48]|uniref:Universal stress protein n=2 Tax=Halostagnicola larsenii TaxID=353800 RepID=W0JRV1_9EURY|nr:universal stress protein [Halostagnicola larsenii XH-48]
MEDIGIETVVLGVRARDDDRAETLVDAVEDIRTSNDLTVIVAYIFDKDSHNETIKQVVGADSEHVDPDELASRMSVVRTITDLLEAASIDVETRAAPGTSGDGLVDIAEDVDADRVIIGGRRRSPTGKALFGSAVQTVMFNAPCPVTFVRDQE